MALLNLCHARRIPLKISGLNICRTIPSSANKNFIGGPCYYLENARVGGSICGNLKHRVISAAIVVRTALTPSTAIAIDPHRESRNYNER
jgi:hypothetical protein